MANKQKPVVRSAQVKRKGSIVPTKPLSNPPKLGPGRKSPKKK